MEQIGRYEVLRELGRGGMATVYLARDPSLGREVAIKMLLPQFTQNGAFRERFRREARAVGRLNHETVVAVYDSGEHDGRPYLVMEYMPGGSLADRINGRPWALADVSAVLKPVAAALDAAHGMGIVHRDLKPGNILFDAAGRAHVADFGIAQLADASQSITGTGLVGTPAYMSPEQCLGDGDITPASDIYSLGVIAYELITGRVPFIANSLFALLRMHREDEPARPSVLVPDLDARTDAAVMMALLKEPVERWPSAQAFIRDWHSNNFAQASDRARGGTRTRTANATLKVSRSREPSGSHSGPHTNGAKSRDAVSIMAKWTAVLMPMLAIVGGMTWFSVWLADTATSDVPAGATATDTAETTSTTIASGPTVSSVLGADPANSPTRTVPPVPTATSTPAALPPGRYSVDVKYPEEYFVIAYVRYIDILEDGMIRIVSEVQSQNPSGKTYYCYNESWVVTIDDGPRLAPDTDSCLELSSTQGRSNTRSVHVPYAGSVLFTITLKPAIPIRERMSVSWSIPGFNYYVTADINLKSLR